jgi:unsaturated rhamnogalacturonyl hydrolase
MSMIRTTALAALATAVLVACAEKPPSTSEERPAMASAASSSTPPSSPGTRPAPISTVDVASIKVKNTLGEPRSSVTIALDVGELRKLWLEPSKTVVVDAKAGRLVSQLVDMDGDEAPDQLVFQTDLAPNETRSFGLRIGPRVPPRRDDFKVQGRFVRERHDDFAWENDRFARRMYGPDLETWHKEPLTSSGIDAWVKRVKKLVISDWYLADNYHADNGEGGDFYSVGKTRGCGGLGVWANEKLHVSKNFVRSRVFANGPIRLVFELDYAAWDAGTGKVSETKRVIVDGGTNFERFESRFERQGNGALTAGIGIANHAGSKVEHDAKSGALISWEPFKDPHGNLGCAIVLPAGTSAKHEQTPSDHLLLSDVASGAPLAYHVGTGWDKSGDFPDAGAWSGRVRSFARELAAPPEISLAKAEGAKPWGARMCDSEMQRHPNVLTPEWDYDTGLVLKGFERIGHKTKNKTYLDYVKRTIDGLVGPDGKIKDYEADQPTLDDINMGKVLFGLLRESPDAKDKERYTKALKFLRGQLATHPRTEEGGFWHKKIYPHQLWLDGLFMASPFMTEYAVVFEEPALFDDAVKQIVLIEKHTRDPKTGLLFHGWDEKKAQSWADPKTGKSASFWGRAMGWYAMGVVDVLEHLPKDHPKRPAAIAVLERLATAIASVQDKEKGVWWQVLDAPKRDKNYLEASASAMFVYALSKAVNNGWIDAKKYAPVAARGWEGTIKQFVELDAQGRYDLVKVCKVAGLGVGPKGGPNRDGTYAYYTGDLTPAVTNDPKGVGAFILASAERE